MSDEIRERVAAPICRVIWGVEIDRPSDAGTVMPRRSREAADAVLSSLTPELAVAAAIAECMDRGWFWMATAIEGVDDNGYPTGQIAGVRVIVSSRGADWLQEEGTDLPTVLAEVMEQARARWGEEG